MKKVSLTNYGSLLFFIIRASFVGICSSSIYRISMQDSYISIILGILIGIIPIVLLYFIMRKYPSKNIIEIINEVFGKYIGNIINIVLGIFILIYTSTLFTNLLTFISSQYLYKTPELVIAITFSIALIYVLNKDINSISKTATILFYITCLLFLLNIFGLYSQINIDNLKPLFNSGFNNIVKGASIFISYNVLPIFIIGIIPYNEITNHKKYIKTNILFCTFSFISIFILAFLLLTIYDINLINLIQHPEFHLLKRLTLVGSIQHFENILSIQWIFDIFIYVVVASYYLSQLVLTYTKKITILKYSQKKLISNILIIIIITYLSISLFPNTTSVNNFTFKKLPSLNYIFFLLIPLLILIVQEKKKIIQEIE